MSNRPSIPADIKRRVLVESGHRCSINVCKQTPYEIHHIVPYEKCKKHEFENLILLCPNCHARVHKGEIDRKSLFMYKKLLSVENKIESLVSIFNTQDSQEEEVLEEENKFYSFRYSFPELQHDDLEEINVVMKYNAIKALHWSRKNLGEEAHNGYVENDFSATFEITYINEKFISLECMEYVFSGGAHGQHYISTLNYMRNPILPLELDDLFIENSNYLIFISNYSRDYLYKTFGSEADKDWINEGTKPEKKYFCNFTLNERGVEFIFNEYQVASYVDGANGVLIPYEHIGDILNQDILA